MKVCACFGVNDESLAASFYVSLCHDIWREHHEVRFEGLGAVRASRGNDIWPESEVRDELAIHDIPLDDVDAGFV